MIDKYQIKRQVVSMIHNSESPLQKTQTGLRIVEAIEQFELEEVEFTTLKNGSLRP